MFCVVLFTVSGGFVLECVWNYNVMQFVLCCEWCCVQCLVGLCWTVFLIIMYCSLCYIVCGAAYNDCWVCVGLYLEL